MAQCVWIILEVGILLYFFIKFSRKYLNISTPQNYRLHMLTFFPLSVWYLYILFFSLEKKSPIQSPPFLAQVQFQKLCYYYKSKSQFYSVVKEPQADGDPCKSPSCTWMRLTLQYSSTLKISLKMVFMLTKEQRDPHIKISDKNDLLNTPHQLASSDAHVDMMT